MKGIGRVFLTVWAGQVVSQVGSSMTGFAMGIYVYQTTGSVTGLAVVMLAGTLPGIVIAPFAGAYVDRFDRRLVMLLSDGMAGVATVAMALLWFAGRLGLVEIIAAVAVAGAAAAFQEPAYRAALPTLVAKEQLGRANGLIEMAPALGTLVAPAIAGVLLFTVGVGAVLAADFATFLVAVVTLVAVRFPAIGTDLAQSSLRSQISDGIRYLRERPGLLGLLGLFASLNLVLVVANVLWLPMFLSFTNEAVLGVLMSTIGVAMLVGSVVMSAWGGPRRRVMGLLGFMGLGGVFLAVAGLRPSLWLAGAGAVGLMLIVPIVNGTSQALWQTKVPLDLQGRVFSTRRMVSQIATPIGFLSAGPLADRVFEPLLVEGGALAGGLGRIVGVGPGRGTALMVTLVGLVVLALASGAYLIPSIRNLERDIPDAVPDASPAAGAP